MMRLHHVAVIVSDYARSKAFYTQILPFTIIAEHYRAERDSWKLDLALNGEYVLELFSFPDPPPRTVAGRETCGLRHLALAVADVTAVRGDLQAKGVACEDVRVDPYTGKRFFFCRDPDDLPVEFYESDRMPAQGG